MGRCIFGVQLIDYFMLVVFVDMVLNTSLYTRRELFGKLVKGLPVVLGRRR